MTSIRIPSLALKLTNIRITDQVQDMVKQKIEGKTENQILLKEIEIDILEVGKVDNMLMKVKERVTETEVMIIEIRKVMGIMKAEVIDRNMTDTESEITITNQTRKVNIQILSQKVNKGIEIDIVRKENQSNISMNLVANMTDIQVKQIDIAKEEILTPVMKEEELTVTSEKITCHILINIEETTTSLLKIGMIPQIAQRVNLMQRTVEI